MKLYLIIGVAIVILIIVYFYMSSIKAKGAMELMGNTVLIADGIEGTKTKNPDVFVIYFKGDNRPPNGESYRALKKIKITESGLFNGTYNTRPGWFMIDENGNLANIVVEGVVKGDYNNKVKIELL